MASHLQHVNSFDTQDQSTCARTESSVVLDHLVFRICFLGLHQGGTIKLLVLSRLDLIEVINQNHGFIKALVLRELMVVDCLKLLRGSLPLLVHAILFELFVILFGLNACFLLLLYLLDQIQMCLVVFWYFIVVALGLNEETLLLKRVYDRVGLVLELSHLLRLVKHLLLPSQLVEFLLHLLELFHLGLYAQHFQCLGCFTLPYFLLCSSSACTDLQQVISNALGHYEYSLDK